MLHILFCLPYKIRSTALCNVSYLMCHILYHKHKCFCKGCVYSFGVEWCDSVHLDWLVS